MRQVTVLLLFDRNVRKTHLFVASKFHQPLLGKSWYSNGSKLSTLKLDAFPPVAVAFMVYPHTPMVYPTNQLQLVVLSWFDLRAWDS